MGKVKFGIGFLLIILNVSLFAQNDVTVDNLAGSERPIDYAVPFLTIATDSRSGAMGDIGAATSPDINSMRWNPAKYAFIENDMGMSVSYTPWLRNLVGDINLANLSFYKRIDKQQVVAATLLYFGLGNITFTDIQGKYNGEHSPYELSVDLAYSRMFSDRVSAGLAFRYIRSDLTGGATVQDEYTKAGNAVAADISLYYLNDDLRLSDYDTELTFGLNIRNIGTKISYMPDEKEFLPTELRLGLGYKLHLDEYNSLGLSADVSKYLVPTTPIYTSPSQDTILKGKDPDVSVVEGMIQSFYDAPGGTSEELHELKFGVGLEYYYLNQFAVRGGYFHEHQNKGNRKFFTAGVGLKLNVFLIDISYLISVNRNNPLANTVRFSLGFDFDAFKAQKRKRN